MAWWLRHNPLPDGFQNEYLHVGNAFDLWTAALRGAWWQVRLLVEGNYWPPGFYAAPMPLLWVAAWTTGTMPHGLLVAGNLLHLAVLLTALHRLGKVLDAPWAPLVLMLCPGAFGALVRYEPNLAVLAYTAAGLAFLACSDGLKRLGPVLGWGLCLGVGLLMDRLSVAFFLGPALLALLPRGGRVGLFHAALGGALAITLAGPWYAWFFATSASELLSQAPVGEIDSAGQVTVTPFPASLLYYPLALLDSQAGPLAGLAMLAALRGPRTRERDMLLVTVGLSVAFFTIIAKKQVFYTLPALVPLAVLAGRGRLAALAVAGGVWSFLSLGLGVVPGGPWLPEAWVSPRHTLARPPQEQQGRLSEAVEALGPVKHALVLSEDESLYEGFVTLAVRERWMWTEARSVVTDPFGTSEKLGTVDALLWITPTAGRWPAVRDVEAQLQADHYALDDLPPVANQLAALRPDFYEVKRVRTEDLDIVVFHRR